MCDRSIWKLLMLFIVAVVFGSFLVTPSATAVSKSLVTSSSATIYVPDDYAKIQWAENAANAGDTIVVRDGTYSENVKVSKRLTIKSKSGPDKTIVRAANSTDYVFEIIADHVNISGFTIDGGIFVNRSSNNSITNNIFTSDGRGIFLWASSCDNIITNNSFSNNEIIITISSNNSIIDNIFENGGIGIYEYGSIEHVTSQTIENNTVNGKPIYYYKNIKGIKVPEDAGQVMIANCSNMIIRNINASSTSNGILLAYTKNSIIDNNTCLNNRNSAIFLSQSVNNSITNNNCSRNGFAAIRLSHSIGNRITNNNCSYNSKGILTAHSSNNIIYLNNFVMFNVPWYSTIESHHSTNIWNTPTKVKYEYDGRAYTNYLGNYWSDYLVGTAFSAPVGKDIDKDGIGDTPYNITTSYTFLKEEDEDKDNYPLMVRSENYFVENLSISLQVESSFRHFY